MCNRRDARVRAAATYDVGRLIDDDYILSFYARCARRIPESGTRFAHRLCAGLREGDRKDLYAV